VKELNIRFILNLLAEPCAPKPSEYAGAHTRSTAVCIASRTVFGAMGAPSSSSRIVEMGTALPVAMAASFKR
jgi:hypothetical protein